MVLEGIVDRFRVFSPGGAAACSQGREALEAVGQRTLSPAGAAEERYTAR